MSKLTFHYTLPPLPPIQAKINWFEAIFGRGGVLDFHFIHILNIIKNVLE